MRQPAAKRIFSCTFVFWTEETVQRRAIVSIIALTTKKEQFVSTWLI